MDEEDEGREVVDEEEGRELVDEEEGREVVGGEEGRRVVGVEYGYEVVGLGAEVAGPAEGRADMRFAAMGRQREEGEIAQDKEKPN